MKWYHLLLLALLCAGTIMLGRSLAQEVPNIKPLECNLQRPTPVDSYMGSYLTENGLEIFKYDTNKDGQRDVEISIPQGDENRYPLFYLFDNNYDGKPDIQWVDKLRDGTCNDVQVYWYGKKEESTRKQGEIADCITQDCDKRKEGEL